MTKWSCLGFLSHKTLRFHFVKTLDKRGVCCYDRDAGYADIYPEVKFCPLSTGFPSIKMLGILTNMPQWI
jgi:hypothetical protein